MPMKKRRPGRPALPADELRDRIVHLRLNDAEHAELQRRAATAGRSMASFVRVKVLGR